MKAAIRKKYVAPAGLVVGAIARPVPGAHEILVRVMVTTVNRTDCAVLQGWPLAIRLFTGIFRPKMSVPGTDFAGIVVETGIAVTRFRVGDKVFGFEDTGLGSQAEYMVVSEEKAVTHLPEGSTFEEAVAGVEGFHYARNFVNKIQIRSGQKVLLNGASGGIGSSLFQILREAGADITATACSEAIPVLTSLGARKVIDYEKEDFTRLNETFDFVLDAVGKSSFGRCRRLLKPGGVYISSELGRGWQNLFLALITPVLGGKKVVFPLPFDIPASLLEIKNRMEKGTYKAVIDRRYPLERISDAYMYVKSGRKIGNVILTIGATD